MRYFFTPVILSIFILSFSGCSTTPQKMNASINNILLNENLPFLLLPPISINKPMSLTQAVSIQYKDQRHDFIAKLEVQDQSFKMVALTPMGITLFSIYSVADHYEFKASPLIGEKLNLQYLLADLQLSYWPAKQLNNRLKKNNALIKLKYNQREVFHNMIKIIDIQYSNNKPWNKNIIFKHLTRDYTVSITLLEMEYL